MRRALLATLCCAFAAFGAAGCGGTKLTVKVDAAKDTNGGQPFYMVVRATEQAAYVTESYDAVRAKVYPPQPDPTVLKTEIIYPGQSTKVTFEKPTTQTVGIYFLFTKPGDRWKTARSAPLPSDVQVEVAGNQIKDES